MDRVGMRSARYVVSLLVIAVAAWAWFAQPAAAGFQPILTIDGSATTVTLGAGDTADGTIAAGAAGDLVVLIGADCASALTGTPVTTVAYPADATSTPYGFSFTVPPVAPGTYAFVGLFTILDTFETTCVTAEIVGGANTIPSVPAPSIPSDAPARPPRGDGPDPVTTPTVAPASDAPASAPGSDASSDDASSDDAPAAITLPSTGSGPSGDPVARDGFVALLAAAMVAVTFAGVLVRRGGRRA
jgi:hypothetical protein